MVPVDYKNALTLNIFEKGLLGCVDFMAAPKIIANYLQVIIGIGIIKCSIKFKKPCGHMAALSHLLTVENDSVHYPDKFHFSPSRKMFKSENRPLFALCHIPLWLY